MANHFDLPGNGVHIWTSQVALVLKNPPTNAEDLRNMDLISASGRSPRGGHANPCQYSCLDNPMDRKAWWATVQGVAESDTTETAQRTHTSPYLVYLRIPQRVPLHLLVNVDSSKEASG